MKRYHVFMCKYPEGGMLDYKQSFDSHDQAIEFVKSNTYFDYGHIAMSDDSGLVLVSCWGMHIGVRKGDKNIWMRYPCPEREVRS